MRRGYRLDLWTDTVAAGGTRIAFLVERDAGTAATNVQRARYLEAGRSSLSFDVLATYHALAALAPQAGVVRLTRYVPQADGSEVARVEEWRVMTRRRQVRREAGVYAIGCVPLEDMLLDLDLAREIGRGGLATWGFRATSESPTAILTRLRDRLHALGYTWVDVGTVTPTAPVSIDVAAATPRAILDAVVDALAAQGVVAECQFLLADDLSEYRLELVTQVAGALAPLELSSDGAARDVVYDEDAIEQATVVVPFARDGVDLREFQCEIQAIDGGTGWCTLRALGGSAAVIIAVDDQFNGQRLFREATGRSFAILDTTASPMRVQLATTDLASGLAVGERVSFRRNELGTGTRRAFATPAKYSPAEVTSTLTGPPRIRTRDLADAGAWLPAAHAFRDWAVERSQLVAVLPTGDLAHVAGTFVLDSAPSANPAAGDWLWFPAGGALVPATVIAYDSGTRTCTLAARYAGQQLTVTQADLTGVRCYRPVGTPMWIQASTVANDELQVDVLTGPGFGATDVLELVQRGLGERVVELVDPAALAATRRKVATIEVHCSGATNRVPNADLAAWAGGAGDPPDGWTIGAIVGTVTRTRTTDPLYTRHGGRSWRLDFAAGASAEVFSPLIPVHPVPGAEQVSAAVALRFTRFTGNVPVLVTLYAVQPDGTRAPLGPESVVRIHPLDTTAKIADALKPALEQWYDAVLVNQSVEAIGPAQLQLGVARPAGAANPACTLYVDIAMLVHRESLPAAAEGGVQWFAHSDALPMVTQAHDVLLARARPLVRFETTFTDLFGLDAVAYSQREAVPGRRVTLRLPTLGITRAARLLGVSGDLDRPETLRGAFDRVPPNAARLLAAELAPPPAAPTVPPLPTMQAWLEVEHTADATNYYLGINGGPQLEYAIDGSAIATPIAPGVLTIARAAATGHDKTITVRARGDVPGDVKEHPVVVQRRVYLPPAEPAMTGVSIGSVTTPCDGGGGFALDYTAVNMPGTETLDWLAEVIIGGSGVAVASDTGVAPGAFPVAVALGLCPGAVVRCTVTAMIAGVPYTYPPQEFTV